MTGPADVEGLKIRSPSRTGVWMLETWKAEPVGMPVPALPQALSKGTIDGALIPFEVAIPLKIAQLTEYSVELDGQRRFGTSTFLLAMNKERYAALPDDLKKIIDDNSGSAIAGEIGAVWDSIEPVGKKIARDQGRTVRELSPEASAAFDRLHQSLSERWVKEAGESGVEARPFWRRRAPPSPGTAGSPGPGDSSSRRACPDRLTVLCAPGRRVSGSVSRSVGPSARPPGSSRCSAAFSAVPSF